MPCQGQNRHNLTTAWETLHSTMLHHASSCFPCLPSPKASLARLPFVYFTGRPQQITTYGAASTTEIYSSTVLEAEVWNPGVSRATLPLEFQGGALLAMPSYCWLWHPWCLFWNSGISASIITQPSVLVSLSTLLHGYQPYWVQYDLILIWLPLRRL
jgi:hypothetical protein